MMKQKDINNKTILPYRLFVNFIEGSLEGVTFFINIFQVQECFTYRWLGCGLYSNCENNQKLFSYWYIFNYIREETKIMDDDLDLEGKLFLNKTDIIRL